MIGNKYGHLTVIAFSHQDGATHKHYVCRCACGEETTKRGDRLRSGEGTSCGCSPNGRARHGHALAGKRTPMYERWYSMIARCSRSNLKNYKYYGGKGVRVCDRWRSSFAAFLTDMGLPPTDAQGKSYHLDRIDPAGDYCPENCRWISGAENRSRVIRQK